MEQKYRAVKDYKINIDYDTAKLRNIINREPRYKKEIINGSFSFSDFKKNTVLLGIRTTLENELKISNKEALNYLMDFPLNFNLELFVKLLLDILPDKIENIIAFEAIDKNKLTTIKEIMESKEDIGHYARLKFNFDKKKELISQNFESKLHIDVQEFLAWAESKRFITLK